MQPSEKPTTHKTRKPKRLVLILLPTLVVVVLGLFLNHFNYWPFQGSKIAGVPDGQLVQLENKTRFNGFATGIWFATKIQHHGNLINSLF